MQLGDVLELQFLDDVADPALAEGFPGDRGHRPRAEQRPQRHFDRAGIRRRHDADLVVGRHFKHFARQFDRELELGLADLRAMRTAEGCVFEILGVPAGALGTGAGREMRHGGPRSGFRCSHDLSFQIASLPLGGGVPPRCLRELAPIVKKLPAPHGRLMALPRRGAWRAATRFSSSAAGDEPAARRRLATFRRSSRRLARHIRGRSWQSDNFSRAIPSAAQHLPATDLSKITERLVVYSRLADRSGSRCRAIRIDATVTSVTSPKLDLIPTWLAVNPNRMESLRIDGMW